MEENEKLNSKKYLNSLLLSILIDTNTEFLLKFDKIIKEKYHVNFSLEEVVEFQFIANRITSNNQERGELCSTTLKKVL